MNPILRFSFLNYMELSDSLSWRGFLKALLISPINQIVKHISFFCHCSIVYVWLATGLACLYLISSFMHNSHSVLRSLWTLLVFLNIINLKTAVKTSPKGVSASKCVLGILLISNLKQGIKVQRKRCYKIRNVVINVIPLIFSSTDFGYFQNLWNFFGIFFGVFWNFFR